MSVILMIIAAFIGVYFNDEAGIALLLIGFVCAPIEMYFVERSLKTKKKYG